MWWAFAGGAAKEILNERKAAQASEDELRLWERQFEIRQKAEEAAEKAKEERARKNREIAKGINPNTGEAYTVYGDGREERIGLPKEAIEAEKKRLEMEAAAIADEKRKLEAELGAKGASREASLARAAKDRNADMRASERQGGLMDLDKARAEAARRPPASQTITPSSLQTSVDRAYQNIAADEYADEGIKAEAAAIYASDAPLEAKQKQLQQLETKRFPAKGAASGSGSAGSSKENPIDAASLSSKPSTPTWIRLPNGKVVLTD